MNKYMLIKFRFEIPSDCWELQIFLGDTYFVTPCSSNISAIDFVFNIINPETEIKTEIETELIFETEISLPTRAKIKHRLGVARFFDKKIAIIMSGLKSSPMFQGGSMLFKKWSKMCLDTRADCWAPTALKSISIFDISPNLAAMSIMQRMLFQLSTVSL